MYVPIGVSCTFKCQNCCNIHYKNNKQVIISDTKKIIELYKKNILVESLVLSGLEPFDNFEQLEYLIRDFREVSNDDIVIYTGYEEIEIEEKLNKLKGLEIIVKIGRYKPELEPKFNKELNLTLASKNQYVIVI